MSTSWPALSNHFADERFLHQALAGLFSRVPRVSGIQVLQGSREHGKDLIFYEENAFGQKELKACVVKNTRITGTVADRKGARVVFLQAKQALDTPIETPSGAKQFASQVLIISPYDLTTEALESISGELRSYRGNIRFLAGGDLLDLFKRYWPEFLEHEFRSLEALKSHLSHTLSDLHDTTNFLLPRGYGSADKTLPSVYVEPQLGRKLRLFENRGISAHLPKQPFAEPVQREYFDALQEAADAMKTYYSVLEDLAFVSDTTVCATLDNIKTLFSEVAQRWEEYRDADRRRLAVRDVRDSRGIALPTSDVHRFANIYEPLWIRLNAAFSSLNTLAQHAQRLYEKDCPLTDDECLFVDRLTIAARLSPKSIFRIVKERIVRTNRPLPRATLIVAPAGFGKTCFSRISAIDEISRYNSSHLHPYPIYVPLRAARVGELHNIESDLIATNLASVLTGVREDKSYDGRPQTIQLYFDGLDEVPDERLQEHLLRICNEALARDEHLRIVITSRDYIQAPWLKNFARVHLLAFERRQQDELIQRWLGSDSSLVAAFYEQLTDTPTLLQLWATPLLATLTILMFRQVRYLPESRVKLYELFLDLLSGGWDLARGVQRESHFTIPQKLFFLRQWAFRAHWSSKSEILEETLSQWCRECFLDVSWPRFKGELLRDGLVQQSGSLLVFSHLSFQEFLCAQYLVRASQERLAHAFAEFGRGVNWWRDVVLFCCGLVSDPSDFISRVRLSAGRYDELLQEVRKMFPHLRIRAVP